MANVQPTKDLTVAKRNLDEHGYCLIADALSPQQVADLKARIEQQAAGEQNAGIAFRDGGHGQNDLDDNGQYLSNRGENFKETGGGVNQRVFFLVNKGQCFRDLVINQYTETLVSHVLGDEFLLSCFTANIAKKGGARMGLHTDQWWMPQPVKRGLAHRPVSSISRLPAPEFLDPDPSIGIAPPVVTSAMWMLTDFTKENGGTELVPGTHLSGAYPEKLGDQSQYDIMQAEAPAGTLMVFDGRIWHGTGANLAGPDRIGLIACYCAPQFRQQENQTLGVDRELWETLSPELRARLGFKVWNAYGRIEGDFGDHINPFSQPTGELGKY